MSTEGHGLESTFRSIDEGLTRLFLLSFSRRAVTDNPPISPAEYMELSRKHGFFERCQTPALSAEMTLQPIRRYHGLLDAAIIFCDSE